MTEVRRPFVIHPLLFAAYPIAFLYAHNVDAVRVATTLRPLALTFLVVGSLLFILKSLLRDTQKAGLLCSLLVLLFFAYGHLYDALASSGLRHRHLLPVLALLSLAAVVTIIRTSLSLDPLTSAANLAALLLIAFSSVQIAAFNIGGSVDDLSNALGLEDDRAGANVARALSGPPPDIYYVIMDSYAGPEVLREVYGFDNGPFLDFLRYQGFYVAERSASNYPHTQESVASSLNYEYLDGLSDIVGEDSTNRSPLTRMIEDSRLLRFLKRYDYEFIVFASGSETTEHYRNADIVLRPPRDITEFERILLYGTLFPVVQDFLVRHDVLDTGTLGLWNFDEWRTRIRFTFEGLKNVPRSDSPRYIFAHILDPHPPFVFDRQGGRAIKPDPAEAYVDEVLFLNSQLREVVAEILSEAEREPIIVLQGDHGFIPPGTPLSEQASLRAKFGILNAYYLPDGGTDRLYESISPVNSFRVILNHYFGTTYELRPDRSFYWTVGRPYRLSEVTDVIEDQTGRRDETPSAR